MDCSHYNVHSPGVASFPASRSTIPRNYHVAKPKPSSKLHTVQQNGPRRQFVTLVASARYHDHFGIICQWHNNNRSVSREIIRLDNKS